MQLTEIDPRFLDVVWPQVEALVESGIVRSECEDFTTSQLQMLIRNGGTKLLIFHEGEVVKGMASVEFHNLPTRRVAFVTLMSGRFMTSEESFGQFAEWCRENGATEIRGWSRPSVARLEMKFGMKPYRQVMRYEL